MFNKDLKKKHSVFYSRKVIDNSTIVETDMFEERLPDEDRLAYGISVKLCFGDSSDFAELSDVTGCRDNAEKLFDLLSREEVFPCQLCEVVEDYLTEISSISFG